MNLSFRALAAISVLLFVAAAPMPYGYFTFVKIITCLAAGYVAYQGYQARQAGIWPWIYGVIAIVFNPIVNIAMPKGSWIALDIVAGIIFGLAAFQAYKKEIGNGDLRWRK